MARLHGHQAVDPIKEGLDVNRLEEDIGERSPQQCEGVVVEILNKVYETGRKYAEGFKKNTKILFDKFLPKWNYRAVPQPV